MAMAIVVGEGGDWKHIYCAHRVRRRALWYYVIMSHNKSYGCDSRGRGTYTYKAHPGIATGTLIVYIARRHPIFKYSMLKRSWVLASQHSDQRFGPADPESEGFGHEYFSRRGTMWSAIAVAGAFMRPWRSDRYNDRVYIARRHPIFKYSMFKRS